MRHRFDEELKELNTALIEMGSMIETAISGAQNALLKQSVSLAKEQMAYDEVINRKEKDIESLCLKLLLHQQPVASDLRLVSAALKMITDMERIGDQAADICEQVTMMPKVAYTNQMERIPQMARVTAEMVRDSIDAFVSRDAVKAAAICRRDDVVDDLFNAVRSDLIELIREDVNNGEQAVDLLMVAKYFERIGDHAVNLAEWVIFAVTGSHKTDRI